MGGMKAAPKSKNDPPSQAGAACGTDQERQPARRPTRSHGGVQGFECPPSHMNKDQGCKVVEVSDPDGDELCGQPVVAKEKCARHYQQAVRGRLGKTKTIAAPGEAAEVKVTTGAELKTCSDRGCAQDPRWFDLQHP